VQFKLHQMGMLCSLKYRGLGDDRYPDKTGMVYSSHRVALDVVRELAPRSVLDLGSGRGYVARECERLGADVTGVDIAPPPGGSPRTFITHDLDEPKLPVDPFAFDVVLLLDVIEHLSNPEDFLVEMRNAASTLRATPSRLVLSTPNVAFASLRASLLLGRFNYAERGILDTTHKRLFTRDSLLSMLADCGYDVERVLPIGVPFEAVVGGPIGRSLARRCDALARRWPTLFAFQFMVLATPSPGIRQLLADTPRRDVSLRSLDAARPRS
jgi:2-polyprenyl-3-methyl-5-hydroxy-6-metoxy-1,4-benzoquinol methylase